MTALSVPPLLETLHEIASEPGLLDRHDPAATERTWTELHASTDLQVWLITWPPGARTGWHDHGSASGAFTTLAGRLHELTWHEGPQARTLDAGDGLSFVPGHLHDVRNLEQQVAVSVHAYSPRLTTMTRYDVRAGRLVLSGVERAGDDW